MEELTDRQRKILLYLESSRQKTALAPSVMEIAEQFNTGPAAVTQCLELLQDKGYIVCSSDGRDVAILRTAASCLLPSIMSIPMLGRVDNPEQALAEDNLIGTLNFDLSLLSDEYGAGRLFGLRAADDSMRDAAIRAGDIVIAERVDRTSSGKLVVVLEDDEETAIVRHFYVHRDQFELRPANRLYKSRFCSSGQVSLLGVVVAMQRCFHGFV